MSARRESGLEIVQRIALAGVGASVGSSAFPTAPRLPVLGGNVAGFIGAMVGSALVSVVAWVRRRRAQSSARQ